MTPNEPITILGKYHYKYNNEPDVHTLLFRAEENQFIVLNETTNGPILKNQDSIVLTTFLKTQMKIQSLKNISYHHLQQYKDEKINQNNYRYSDVCFMLLIL